MYMYVITSRAKEGQLESELQFQAVACWADLLSEFPPFFHILPIVTVEASHNSG